MIKEKRRFIYISIVFGMAFVLWTLVIKFVDVKSIVPNGSVVGFATINRYFHNLTGVNLTLYNITDWLGLVPLIICFCFAILGLIEWLKRKSILKVDLNLLLLGGFYILVFSAYILFEMFAINYRPILINGYLEASYPSSTTLLVMCVIPTAMMQFNFRIKKPVFRKCIFALLTLFIVFMVVGRLISGVHWLSDIIGGALLSCSLVTLYYALI